MRKDDKQKLPSEKFKMITEEEVCKRFAKALKSINPKTKEECEEFYNKTGLNLKTLKRYKKGKNLPKTSNLAILCKVYKLDANYILGIYEPKKNLP